jgi:hypothetical protein
MEQVSASLPHLRVRFEPIAEVTKNANHYNSSTRKPLYAAGNAIDAQMANFLDGMAKTVEKK